MPWSKRPFSTPTNLICSNYCSRNHHCELCTCVFIKAMALWTEDKAADCSACCQRQSRIWKKLALTIWVCIQSFSSSIDGLYQCTFTSMQYTSLCLSFELMFCLHLIILHDVWKNLSVVLTQHGKILLQCQSLQRRCSPQPQSPLEFCSLSPT